MSDVPASPLLQIRSDSDPEYGIDLGTGVVEDHDPPQTPPLTEVDLASLDDASRV
jgi:hypothetical protein